MFGFKKKPAATPPPLSPLAGPPPLPAEPDALRVGFATAFMHVQLSQILPKFSRVFQAGAGDQMLAHEWERFCRNNLPEGAPVPENQILSVRYGEEGRMVVGIEYSAPRVAGEPYCTVILFGPCSDPQWADQEALARMPYRWFVFFRDAARPVVEEWTTGEAVPLGSGPDPDFQLCVEWAVDHALGRTGFQRTRREDPAMVEAIARAKRELPGVLQRFQAGELAGAGFTVKVAIREGEEIEHLWLSQTTFADGCFSGCVECEVRVLAGVKTGDRLSVPTEDVTDWAYLRDGKMHGNYTLRAMLPGMPPAARMQWEGKFSDTPEN